MLITQAEFARIANVSRSAVRQAINSGLITAIVEQNGKTLIQKNEALQQYQANSRRQNKPDPAASSPAPTINPETSGLDLLSWGQASAKAPVNNEEPIQTPRQAATEKAPGETVPEYGKSRARSEYEKANLLELERKRKENLLIYKIDYDKAQNAVIQEIIRQGDILPRIIQQRIPKLTVEDMEEIEDIVREMFTVVSDAEFEELDQGEE